MTIKTLALAGLLAISASVTQAATYNFSFSLDNGNKVYGALTGTVSSTDSNLVTDAFVTTFNAKDSAGTLFYGDLEPTAYAGSFFNALYGRNVAGVVSFDGSTLDIIGCINACNFGFGLIWNNPNFPDTYGKVGLGFEGEYLPETWSLTEVPAVPLPASAPLVLAGIAALVALRRKRA